MFVTHRGRAPSSIATIVAGALLAILTAGCGARVSAPAPEFISLRITDGDLDREPRVVSAGAALVDLDAALRVFDEAYAGVDGDVRTPSPAAVSAARVRLAARPSWTPRELAAELCALFRKRDGHLAFGYGGRAPLRLPAWPRVDGPQRTASVDVLPEDGQPRILEASAEPAPRDAAVAFVRGDVPVLAIRTFDSAQHAALDALPAMAQRLRRSPAFVVDLRGNGGGNFRYAEAFVLALTDATLQRLDEREVKSVAAAEGRANRVRFRIAMGTVPAEARPAFEAHLAAVEAEASMLREAGAVREDVVRRGATVRGTARGPLRSRAVFLVDRGCASACEMMVALARQIPGVIIAGENTRGGMAAGELALFRLPRSGVTVSLGTRAFHDPLGDFEEVRGYIPDVSLDPVDALRGARRLAAFGPSSPKASGPRTADLHEPAARGPARAR